MSKKNTGASEINGFIAINDRSSKASKTVKNVRGSNLTGGSQTHTSTAKTVTNRLSDPKETKGEKKKVGETVSVSKSRVIDVKITKKSDTAPSPRVSRGPTKTTASRPSGAPSVKASSTKPHGTAPKISTATSKVVTSVTGASPRNRTLAVGGLSSKAAASKTSSITAANSKTSSIRKTTTTTTKSKAVNESSLTRKSISGVGKSNLAVKNNKNKEINLTKTSKGPTSSKLNVAKDTNIAKTTIQKAFKVIEEEEENKNLLETPLPSLKREGTWIKEDEDNTHKNENQINNESQENYQRENKDIDVSKTFENEESSKVVNKNVIEQPLQSSISDDEPYYDDDFEDYESDFEEYQSDESGVDSSRSASDPSVSSSASEVSETSEESEISNERPEDKKLDSGNYDMRKSKTGFYHPPPSSLRVQEENELIENYIPANGKERKLSNSEDQVEWRPPIKQPKISKVKQRGEKLLEMIKLDVTSITLLTMAPIPYDIFIKVYGKKNTQQRCIQTNEDSSHQDVQTDEIRHKDKWTQCPVKYHNWGDSVEESLTQFYKDRKGVGDDNPVNTEFDIKLSYDLSKLNRFLDYASEVMIVSLEESGLVERGRANAVKTELPFSQGCLLIQSSNQDYLSGRKASLLTFSPHNPNYILIVYSPKDDEIDEDQLSSRCLICLWNVLGGDAPPKSVLIAPSTVSSVDFDSLHPNIIYAGLNDGGVCVWELKNKGIRLNIGYEKHHFRPPSFSTCGVMGEEGHFSAVISVQSLTLSGIKLSDKFIPGQLASLEELGKVILWSVVTRQPWETPKELAEVTTDLGAAPWSTVLLIHSLSVTPFHQIPRYSRFTLKLDHIS